LARTKERDFEGSSFSFRPGPLVVPRGAAVPPRIGGNHAQNQIADGSPLRRPIDGGKRAGGGIESPQRDPLAERFGKGDAAEQGAIAGRGFPGRITGGKVPLGSRRARQVGWRQHPAGGADLGVKALAQTVQVGL
jgi:hypothetical protein